MEQPPESIRLPIETADERDPAAPGTSRDGDVRTPAMDDGANWRMRLAESRARHRRAATPAGGIAGPAVALLQPGRTGCDAGDLASTLASSALHAKLFDMVCSVVRRRYGIRAEDAEDVFQDAVVTYLEVRERYPAGANHFGLLVGISHRKALKALAGSRKRARRLELLAARVALEQRGRDPIHSPEWPVIRDERDAAIRKAIAALPHPARETLLSIAEGTERRLELIARLGVNRNTFDSRLHVARTALRRDLARRGGF
jgi:RNA polymerase sigma factor (sigma-70 family)